MRETIAVIGTGLVGGSVGLALGRAGGYRVVGYDAVADNLAAAREASAIDEIAANVADAASRADIVLIATPVGEIPRTVELAAAAARPGTILTDVGSTKRTIVEQAERSVGEERSFVGGHPMAGTEGEGISAAREDLFDDALWILTPTERTDSEAYRRVNALVTEMGARTLALHPDEHDTLVARVSHLPYAVATTLMAMAGEGGDPRVFSAAAGSFRDMTRTAGTNPRVWHDILSTNAAAIERELGALAARLEGFRSALGSGDLATIDAVIAEARDARRRLPLKGGREPAEPVTVEVRIPDRAGVLAEVTTAIGEGGINIEDVWMEHTPSGGVLRLVLDGRTNASSAMELLAARGFRSTIVEDR